MKKYLILGLFFLVGLYCFAQELVVTRIEDNTNRNWGLNGNGKWPTGDSGREWDAVLNSYNMVRLQNSDPFAQSDPLEDRIAELSHKKAFPDDNGGPHTVYLTMGNRKFICLIYSPVLSSSYYSWTYEIK
jgi:hypothetical protein